MSRKVFLSFLGINDYVPVRYYEDGKPREEHDQVEKYIQKSILDLLQKKFGPQDAAYIFLTPQARRDNWESGEKGPKLASQIIGKYDFPVTPQDIDEESTKAAIDNIFLTLFDTLQERDEVYLDITHSWRYLPLLGANLLNYAKALKNIEVKKIYYGALERLGSIPEIKNMPESDRWVPILDLQNFSELQDWAVAARDFARYGQPQKWRELTSGPVKKRLKETRGGDQNAQRLRIINQDLDVLDQAIRTNRGKDLMEFNFDRIKESLDNFTASENDIRPLHPILDLLKEKITPFFGAADKTWLQTVKWCIDHDLVQQGMTQLQEGLFTWICLWLQQKGFESEYFDWKKKEGREFVSSLLSKAIQAKEPEENWRGELKNKAQLAQELLEDPLLISLASITAQLTDLRNDINHGGYTKTSKASTFSEKLSILYHQVNDQIASEDTKIPQAPKGLLNLSNHPSSRWPEAQRQAALEAYGSIEDLPFPQISPEDTPEDIDKLAKDYLKQVLERKVQAVHLMGEMTFTFSLIQKLQAQGIPCIASTTERQAIDHGDGKKEVVFKFVQFRAYN